MKTVKELCAAFMKYNTPTVSDALDKLGIPCGLQGLKPVVENKKIVGPAFTVTYVPIGLVKTGVGDFIDETKEGDVIVIDNGGREYCTVWGDILTYVAVQKKLAGTIIDGVCRDVDGIRELGYPMFTKGYYMVTGKDRVELPYHSQPVSICNVRVRPGDLIMADQSGALVIPIEKAEEVLNIAETVHNAEEGIIEEIKKGSSLIDARKKYNYSALQRKGE